MNTVSARAERSAQPLSGEPARRGVLTRSRLEAPDGQAGATTPVPECTGDFSPHLLRSPDLRRLGFVPMFQGARHWIRREGEPPDGDPASASRSTTPDSRPSRRPDVPFALSGGISIAGVLNADHSDVRRIDKCLILLSSNSRMQGIQTPQRSSEADWGRSECR